MYMVKKKSLEYNISSDRKNSHLHGKKEYKCLVTGNTHMCMVSIFKATLFLSLMLTVNIVKAEQLLKLLLSFN